MTKIKSTYDEFVDSLSTEEKNEFYREREALLIEEMIHAAMQEDNISVRKLAKLAGVSPTIVQGIKSGTRKNTSIASFIKILDGLGYKLTVTSKSDKNIQFDVSGFGKDN